MKFVADLHLHSKYSRAVSQQMVLTQVAIWAKYKGIQVLATGDFTHPFWFEQLKNELEDAGNGLYKLRHWPLATSHSIGEGLKVSSEIYFLLSCEISSIYSQGGKVRRIHNLFFFPSLKSVEVFNKKLLDRGANLRADGRPIVGINSRDLALLALEVDDKALIIPAHAWTPWFSIFGSFSGFDSIDECFGDMSKYIYGIETGLSSDPAMNWQIGDLDSLAILSFSDAHSLEKMGREATVFEASEISYEAIYKAIAGPFTTPPPAYAEASAGSSPANDKSAVMPLEAKRSGAGSPSTGAKRKELSDYPKIALTIEFYPEEGKYHFTGHRDCNFSQSVTETQKNGDTCPVCKRKLTVGVEHRVEDLKTREQKYETRDINGIRYIYPEGNLRPPYVKLVPLCEIIAEVEGSAIKTKKVFDQYSTLVNSLDNEFNVLLKTDLSEISKFASPKVVEGIEKVRLGNIKIDPGYDGKFGEVKIWDETEIAETEKLTSEKSQLSLFAA